MINVLLVSILLYGYSMPLLSHGDWIICQEVINNCSLLNVVRKSPL